MISKETVEKIADLARLELKQDQIDLASKHLSAILEHFNELNELDTKDIEPLTTPTEIIGLMAEDKIKKCEVDMLSNAPDKSGNLFKVPPVV